MCNCSNFVEREDTCEYASMLHCHKVSIISEHLIKFESIYTFVLVDHIEMTKTIFAEEKNTVVSVSKEIDLYLYFQSEEK